MQYLVSSVVVLPNVVLVSISRPLVIHREMLPHWLTALLLPTSVPVSGRRKPIMWALVTFTSAVGSRPSGVRSPFNAAKGPALFELLELPANGQLPTWSVSLLRSCILLPLPTNWLSMDSKRWRFCSESSESSLTRCGLKLNLIWRNPIMGNITKEIYQVRAQRI